MSTATTAATQSWKQHCTALFLDINDKRDVEEGEKWCLEWERFYSFWVMKFFISLSGMKETEPCQKPCRAYVSEWVTCKFSSYCHGGVSKNKNKNQSPLMMQICIILSLDFVFLQQPDGMFINIKKNCQGPTANPVYIATYPYWSGWCIMGAWALP